MPGRALIALCAVGAACGPRYVYVPTEDVTAFVDGHAADAYLISPNAPRGAVRLASFGFSTVSPPNALPGERERALHLRMVVANDSGEPWHLDPRQQFLEIGRGRRISPVLATSPQRIDRFPTIVVAPHAKRIIDLFYRLPLGMNSAADVRRFQEVWRLDLPARTIVERTPFERMRDEREELIAGPPSWEW